MPTTCCVRGCKSRGFSNEGNKIKYFRFPKDEARRLMWVKAINRKNFVPSNYSVVCHTHFTNDDYQKRPDLIKLTNRAVPSIFNNAETNKQNSKHKNATMDAESKFDLKPLKNCYDNLLDHTYVLKLPEPSTSDESSEKSIDPSTYMVQTLNVGGSSIDDSYVLDLSKPNKQTSKNFETDENPQKNWREIAIAQSNTINDLRKKVKVLQQKIRRQKTKIEALKNFRNNAKL